MKEKLIKWSKPLLTTCMGLGWWISGGFPSIVLLGEYSYPQKDE